MQPHRPSPEETSFCHLREDPLSNRTCQGTACFVARHLQPERWCEACAPEARANCLGKCHVAPSSTREDARPSVRVHAPRAIVLERLAQGGARTLDAAFRFGAYMALAQALHEPREELLLQVERSGLRGRGDAGSPTGRKLRAVAEQRAEAKVVAANAAEVDAGACIDRFLLEDDPHRVIEGLALAAYAVGARRGYLSIRKESPLALERMTQALAEARKSGLLGERILGTGFSFDIECVTGLGSYVRQPTLVQNVETLVNLPWIVRHGGAAYESLGVSSSRGTKVVSLNSLFHAPGLYEIEFGIPVRTLIEELGGGLKTGTLQGVIIGGPLAGIMPPHLLDTPFGFDELRTIGASVGHGGVVAFDEHTSLPELIHHVFSFGAYESCGKCAPWRLGVRRIEQLFARVLAEGSVPRTAQCSWVELFSALRQTRLCGHGMGLGEFAESVLRHYRKEVDACFT